MTWTITLLINENTGVSSAGNRTSASFTPPANSLLVAFAVGGRDNQTVARNWQINDSLSGAWTNIAESALTNWGPNVAYNARYALNVRAWRQAIGSSPAARTVTVDASTNSEFYALIIYAITGHDVASPLAQAAVANAVQAAVEGDSALSLTLTLGSAPTSGNMVLAMFGAGADGGGGFAVPTGYTALANQNLNYCPGAVFYHTSTTTAAVTCSDLGQTVGNAGGIILEIAAAAGGTITEPIGLVSEADSAQPVTAAKTKAAGQPGETDTVLPTARAKTKAIGQTAATAVAQPVTAQKTGATGAASEVDSAQAITNQKTKTAGQPSESDVAQPVTARKTAVSGQVSETDVALPVARIKRLAIGQATETDSALTFVIGSETVVAIGLVSETDVAQPVARVKRMAIGQAVESVTALPMTARKTAVVGQVQETDEALALVNRKALAIGLVSETAVALAMGAQKRLVIGQASEIDAVFTLVSRKTAVIGLVSEMDVALAFVLLGLGDVVREVVLAGQFDPVVVLVGQFDPDVALAGEFDPVVSLRGEL